MADYYLDASALVKRYISESGSTWVTRLFDPVLDNEIFMAAITPVEIAAAISRRARGGSIARIDATLALSLLRSDMTTDYQVVELTDRIIARAMAVAENHGLRGYDAVQLASAVELNAVGISSGLLPITFVCADNNLNGMARLEGLIVDNPNLHP